MATELLLVEDSHAHAELVRRALADFPEAISLRVVTTIAEAKAAIAETKPDIMLLDLHLLDGTAKELLPGSPDGALFPVVILTGQGDEVLAVACIKAGAMDYLVKSPETLRALPLTLQRITNDWSRVLEHRRILDSLRESEDKFRKVFDLSPVGSVMVDLHRRFIRCNEAFCRFLGYEESELVGRSFQDFTHPEDLNIGIDEMEALFEGRIDNAKVEKRYIRKDGITVWGEVTMRVIKDHKQFPYYIPVVQDITERKQWEVSLRQSEEQYRTLVENVPGVVFRSEISFPRQMAHLSHETAALTGYDMQDFLRGHGLAWENIILKEDVGRVQAEVLKSIAERKPYAIEYRIRTKGGSIRYVNERGRCTFAPDGRPLWLDGVIVDATERKQFEQALRESEERLRLAMDAANAGLWDWDVALDRVYWSPRNFQMLDFAPGAFEVNYKSWSQMIHADDSERVQREMKQQIGQQGHFSVDYRMRTQGGSFKWVNGRGKVVSWSEDHKPLRVVGTNSDIDQRVQAELKLQENNQRLHALFDEANDAIFVADADTGLILDVNNQAEQLMGMTRDELVGLHQSKLHPKEIEEEMRRVFSNPNAGIKKLLIQTDVETRKRGIVPVEIGANKITLQDGRKIIQGIFRDISERRNLEAQLRQAQKMEAIGQLAGGVAHDFNNVLAAIMLQLGMLQTDDRLPPDMSSSLTLLEASTKRAAELTRQLLLFGRRQPAKLQPVDLDILLVNLLKMLRRLIGEAIHLEFTPRSNNNWLFADPSMIEQVVMNLVVNARDAMPQGGRIAIATKIVDGEMPVTWVEKSSQANSGTYVCLAITDTGCGMDEAVLKKLFEPFFTTKEQGKGTGLGLATAYGIVKQHQGWIDVQSQVGKGTCFHVYLPLRVPLRAHIGDNEQVMQVSPGCETILLVEDDAIVRTFTSLSLRASGYTVLEACDGEEALRVWERQGAKVELLLSDMVMPHGLTGWNLAQLMRKDRPDLPVLLMSGYSDDLPRSALEPENGVVFLQKPFDTAKLTQSLRITLKSKGLKVH